MFKRLLFWVKELRESAAVLKVFSGYWPAMCKDGLASFTSLAPRWWSGVSWRNCVRVYLCALVLTWLCWQSFPRCRVYTPLLSLSMNSCSTVLFFLISLQFWWWNKSRGHSIVDSVFSAVREEEMSRDEVPLLFFSWVVNDVLNKKPVYAHNYFFTVRCAHSSKSVRSFHL